jgi:hypothetical protein
MAETSIRLCTPGRQVSHSGGLMICIEIFLSFAQGLPRVSRKFGDEPFARAA